ncbi:MAG: D-alanine--D-alanine ligase [Gammaproteobacteria bacterium]
MIASAREFGRVAVLMGGTSGEREVSLMSGEAVLNGLRARGIDAHGIDAQPDVVHALMAGEFDRVFIALHGRRGEDGVIQGALDMLGLPYTGSGVLGSALCMDKVVSKQLWRSAGLPTPAYAVLDDDYRPGQIAQTVGVPLIVKPAHEGSSLGMSKVSHLQELGDAVREARRYDGPVIAERWVESRELTFSILGDEVLPGIWIETPRVFYDYVAKYKADDTVYHCPIGLPASEEKALQSLARRAFDVSQASGWGRVDLLLDADGEPWLIDINTVPGMTSHSLVPKAAAAAGIDFETLVWRILETSFKSND